MKKVSFLLSLLVYLFLLTGTLWADGVYIPDRAFRKLPEIPTQRAIVSYKDNIETMIVESSVNEEGQSFGWILAIPAEPTELTKVPTELLSVFANNTEPEVIHDRPKSFLIIFVALTLFFVVDIFVKKDFYVHFCLKDIRKVDLLLMFMLALLIAALIGPSLSAKESVIKEVARIAGIDVKRQIDIGNYEISVLKAARADDLNAWLDMNGFIRVPSAGVPIVEDYIKQHWAFVVAKLKTQGSGLSTPHPVLIRFPVDRAIYPMKLTALSEANLFLQLFIVGDQRATLDGDAKGPRIEFSDRYSLFEPKGEKNKYVVFKGESFHQFLSHPLAKEILWPGCVVTCYDGMVTPTNMTSDYAVTFSHFAPYRRHYFSKRGAFTAALSYTLILWSVSLIVASLLVNQKGKIYVFTRILLPALCICIFLLGASYLTLPKVETTIVSGLMSSRSRVASFQIWKLKEALNKYKKDTGEYPSTSQGLAALISNPGVKGWNGPYRKEAIPRDPWNNAYHYYSPAAHSPDIRGRWSFTYKSPGKTAQRDTRFENYDLYSYGEDNAIGGVGESEDITSWSWQGDVPIPVRDQ